MPFWLEDVKAAALLDAAKDGLSEKDADGACPKWRILQQLLSESNKQKSAKRANDKEGIVHQHLVMVSHPAIKHQLAGLLKHGSKEYLERQRQSYLSWKLHAESITRLCMSEVDEKTGKATGRLTRLPPHMDAIQHILAIASITVDTSTEETREKDFLIDVHHVDGDDEQWLMDTYGVIIGVYGDAEEDIRLLDKHQITAITLYNQPKLSFVRQLEIYQAKHPHDQLLVNVCLLEDSHEESQHLLSIRREREAFLTLRDALSVIFPKMNFAQIVFCSMFCSFWMCSICWWSRMRHRWASKICPPNPPTWSLWTQGICVRRCHSSCTDTDLPCNLLR